MADHEDFVQCDQGHWHWGTHGAAGLLLRHQDLGNPRYLLAHRSGAVHHPGTWAPPGGARAPYESPEVAAVREASEELGHVPAYNVKRLHTIDHGNWQYHLIGGDAPEAFEPTLNHENDDAGWFTPAEVDELPLHPDFRRAWNEVTKPPDAYQSVWPIHETRVADVSDSTAWEIAYEAAGAGSGAVMFEAPDVVMPTDTIIPMVEEILHDHGVWHKAAEDPKDRVTKSANELCVMLEIPDDVRRQIRDWVDRQDWPEGTELHEPEKYHITLMYTPEGYDEHKDADWIEHLPSAKAKVTGLDVFTQDPEGRYPYVLRIHAPEIKAHAEMLQGRAEDKGLEITHFPGGYKPHLTVGYGPEDKLSAEEHEPLEFTAGPSFISEPRDDEDPDESGPSRSKEKEEKRSALDGHSTSRLADNSVPGKVSPEHGAVNLLDDLSLKSVAHNLHYRFEQGHSDPAELKSYAERILRMIGYPVDDMTTLAALQAWQTLYPEDKALPSPQEPSQLQAPPTVPTESWGYGTVSGVQKNSAPGVGDYVIPRVLYHWTDASSLADWMDPAHTGPGETYLTASGDDPSEDWNPDVPRMTNPVRLTIDTTKLDPRAFDADYSGWLGNYLYHGAVPPSAVTQIRPFRRPDEWENTEPSLDYDWRGLGEDESHHQDIQTGNDTWALAKLSPQ